MNRDWQVPQPAGAPAPTGALARLIELAPGQCIALPPHTTLDLVEHPRPLAVPGAPRHVHGLLAWQESRIPMIDLVALVRGAPAVQGDVRYALVVAYQTELGRIAHGAIALAALPVAVQVQDDAACALPQDSAVWQRITLSCFRHEGQPVPIVDTGRLFGACHG